MHLRWDLRTDTTEVIDVGEVPSGELRLPVSVSATGDVVTEWPDAMVIREGRPYSLPLEDGTPYPVAISDDGTLIAGYADHDDDEATSAGGQGGRPVMWHC